MIDRERALRAAQRAKEALVEQEYHERQAAAAKARVDSMIRTWNLDPVTLEPLDNEEKLD